MARTTVAKVKEILDTSLTDPNIQAYIDSANIFTTATVGESDLGDGLLAEIERWLSAHLITISKERQTKKEKVGSVSVEYTGKYGEQLKMTSYGQMVLFLDTSGSFANLGLKSATITAVTSFEGK